jgi:hypothetical protein
MASETGSHFSFESFITFILYIPYIDYILYIIQAYFFGSSSLKN